MDANLQEDMMEVFKCYFLCGMGREISWRPVVKLRAAITK